MARARYYPEYMIVHMPETPLHEHPDRQLFFSWWAVLDMLVKLQEANGNHLYVALDCNDNAHPCITIGD